MLQFLASTFKVLLSRGGVGRIRTRDGPDRAVEPDDFVASIHIGAPQSSFSNVYWRYFRFGRVGDPTGQLMAHSIGLTLPVDSMHKTGTGEVAEWLKAALC